jgi:hypothetical protein
VTEVTCPRRVLAFRPGENTAVPQNDSIVELLHELSSVQGELKLANRDLIDALSRGESAERLADLEQQVALLNEISDSLAERVKVLAEAQLREGRS